LGHMRQQDYWFMVIASGCTPQQTVIWLLHFTLICNFLDYCLMYLHIFFICWIVDWVKHFKTKHFDHQSGYTWDFPDLIIYLFYTCWNYELYRRWWVSFIGFASCTSPRLIRILIEYMGSMVLILYFCTLRADLGVDVVVYGEGWHWRRTCIPVIAPSCSW